jgi:hypothetical protein
MTTHLKVLALFFSLFAEVVGFCPFLFLAIQYKWASFSCLLRSSSRESRSCDSAAQLKWCALSCTPILHNLHVGGSFVIPVLFRWCCRQSCPVASRNCAVLPSEASVCQVLFSLHPSMVSHGFGSLGAPCLGRVVRHAAQGWWLFLGANFCQHIRFLFSWNFTVAWNPLQPLDWVAF